ncbi:M48 family metalloprotease [Bacteriovorax sp. Seq25_V]|uniref:M48 family metalloprotease n=1 Tax=Bacteriovorax sp. Seq25_V TaxID=1201288 RepID=UPI00038A2EF3|nr:M48 family metalloprotease [Bacteriovorax sp. Seq25_V]EQC45690.1 peptidase, M48 family [Bacteriovorax sp. Seq25_V]
MEDKIINQLNHDLNKLNSTKQGRRAFLTALPLLLASCATTDKTRYREGDNSGQEVGLSVEEERKMTREYLPEMEKDYQKYRNSYVQSYINDVGRKIVDSNKLAGNPYNYNFRVVASNQINAFALPAGEVFVTSKLIAMTDSEAELAGVIGHEVGHIQARHTAERIYKAEKEKNKGLIYGLGGALLGGAAGFGLGKMLCSKQDRDCLMRVAKYGAMAGGMGGLLIQKYGFMANSREDEMEADRIGFKTSLKAGYDYAHVGNFYEKLLVMEKNYSKKDNALAKKFADAMSTHPPSEQRVAQMRELERANPLKGKVTSPEFEKIKKILV